MHRRSAMCAIGRKETARTESGSRSRSVSATVWAWRLAWVISTPLGGPLVPDV